MKIQTDTLLPAVSSAPPAAVPANGSEKFGMLLQQWINSAASITGISQPVSQLVSQPVLQPIAPLTHQPAPMQLDTTDFPDFQSTAQKFGALK